jgi:hypothetical protein
MDFAHGLLLGIFGCLATFVGFFIAYLVVARNHRKENKKKRPLSSVEESLKNLNAKFSDTE